MTIGDDPDGAARAMPIQRRLVNAFGTPRAVILDTDFILNQVIDAVALGSLSSVLSAGLHRQTYASQHVFDEFYGEDAYGRPTKWHKLSEQAKAGGEVIAHTVFQIKFEADYLSDLAFVRMGDLFVDHPLVDKVRRAENGRGACDAPTAQLAVLLSRVHPVNYSHDRHLRKTGVAPRWLHEVDAAHQAEGQVAHSEQIYIGTAGLGGLTLAGFDKLVVRIGSLIGISPLLSRMTAIAGLGVVVAKRPDLRQKVGRALNPLLQHFLDQHGRMANGLELLELSAVDVEVSDSIESKIAEVLVRHGGGEAMLVPEIRGYLATEVQMGENAPSVAELRRLLKKTPCFEEGPRWRYRLGHQYVPTASKAPAAATKAT
jgi:hypothetical protein